MISELDVTLTDYGLAVECALFAKMLVQVDRPACPLCAPLVVFFAMGCVASFAGGTWHGFFHDGGPASQCLWIATLLAVGTSALAAWTIGARLICEHTIQRVITTSAFMMTIAYTVVVVSVSHSFVIAIVNYLPALVFLTGSFLTLYVRVRSSELIHGMAGLLLMFVAAGIQWGGSSLDLANLNHNAIYHIVQGVALALFFKAAFWCVETDQVIFSAPETTNTV